MMDRTTWRRGGIGLLACFALIGGFAPSVSAKSAHKVIILGIDGMDNRLLQKFMDEGVMPNFKQLIAEGDYKPLQTSMPPLSPVAWSTFITGMDPSGHGIFDFVHRDPATIEPYLSMAKVSGSEKEIHLGHWVIPLKGGNFELLRKGKAFWQILDEKGIPATIFRIPANFPPAPTKSQSFSGMGTPDILGSPGTFSFYTNDKRASRRENVTGGEIYEVRVKNNRVDAQLIGPPNSFRVEEKKEKKSISRKKKGAKTEKRDLVNPDMTVDFSVFLDPRERVAKFKVQDYEFILKEGEWSDWVSVDFEAVPWLVSVSAVGRFYLQQVQPYFKLYVTPLQISVENPAMPISTPEDWSHDLFEALGNFYTQQLPEDTKALSNEIFTGREFWEQAQFVYHERRRALDYMIDQYEDGLLFFYFSSVDQSCHMMWRYDDKAHPGYVSDDQLRDSIKTLYMEMDDSLARVMEKVDGDTTLIIMSDHGFAPFYWGVNLNSWLVKKGYVTLKDPSIQGQFPLFANVDWSKTQAYGLGLNGLYVNLKGREKNGIVQPGKQYDRLIERLGKDLLAMKDPRNGKNPVSLAFKTHQEYSGPYLDVGPDILVGYSWGYRSSWESPLGEFPKKLFVDNDQAWSGDHSMDYRLVPGVLITNKKITIENPALYDLTVAVLDEYGIAKTPEMIGRDCIGEKTSVQAAAPSDVKTGN